MMENYKVMLINLPGSIKGFTSYNAADDFYDIVLNASLSYPEQQEAFRHEMNHISNGDFYSNDSVSDIEYTAVSNG